jgi:alcohol dehydrogenase class IV
MEAYVSVSGGLLTDIHAREAFASVWAALPAACAGNEKARAKLQTASVLTGLAVEQAGLGLCRAMENSLGMVFGLSRGKAAGILLPVIVGCNAHAAGRRYAQLSRAAGMGGSNEGMGVRNLRSGLLRLRQELGLPGSLIQAGIDIRTIWNSGSRIVEMTLEDPECRNNPVAVDDFLVRRILEEITGRF